MMVALSERQFFSVWLICCEILGENHEKCAMSRKCYFAVSDMPLCTAHVEACDVWKLVGFLLRLWFRLGTGSWKNWKWQLVVVVHWFQKMYGYVCIMMDNFLSLKVFSEKWVLEGSIALIIAWLGKLLNDEVLKIFMFFDDDDIPLLESVVQSTGFGLEFAICIIQINIFFIDDHTPQDVYI